jgi:type III restriction enzyme
MSVSVPLDNFPLAEGIFNEISTDIDALVTHGEGRFVTDTTSVTSELLRFWFHAGFCDLRERNFHEGQRDAILAVVYAHEILGATTLEQLYNAVAPQAILGGDILSEITDSRNKHPKYAAKMATGTGKTWVLNALLIWQYLNSVAAPEDERYSRNFLVVAPGLIVYDRLLDSFQGRLVNGSRVFETSDIVSTKELFVPENFENALFGFLQGSVVTKKEIGRKVTGSGVIAITNWHLLTGENDDEFADAEDDGDQVHDPAGEIDTSALVDAILPLTPGVAAGNALDVLDRRFRRGEALDYLVDLPSLVVFNDEAHHIHAFKNGEDMTEVEWQKSLRKIAATKKHRFVQMDFSATPYNEVTVPRKGKTKKFFSHIVVDFDLRTAMSKGLVKNLIIDRRSDIAALPLDFAVEKDESGNISLSQGQRTMIRAGLTRLNELAEKFESVDSTKHPKMMIMCEDTKVVPLVEEFLISLGLSEDDVLSVHSGKKAELSAKDWEPVRERLFGLDKTTQPRVVVSVLMLREGFDVNNICVIVPLRAASASILLEQTIGRGLRLMWRGDEAIDDVKRESRRLILQKKAPSAYFDMLFVVEHPAFIGFYDELLEGGAGIIDDGTETPRPGGDVETVELRNGFEQFDFVIPFVLRDADEELREPVVNPTTLSVSKYRLENLRKIVGTGDVFTGEHLEHGTRFGDYRVDGGVMTATGYNDFLSRLADRIVKAHQRAFVTTTQQFNNVTAFPILQSYQRLVIGWLDDYIRNRYFGESFDPMNGEDWRLLLLEQVPEEISGEFGRVLVDLHENIPAGEAEVFYRRSSEVTSIRVRTSSSVVVSKCIFEKLPYPSNGGGLERDFIEWVDSDSHIAAVLKIDEYKHVFLRRPYLKADGMPAQYSPDFLVRSEDKIFVVETKSQTGLNDANVQRKKKSALGWVESINALEPEMRDGYTWYYVLAGETAVRNHINNGSGALDFLSSAVLFDTASPNADSLF